MARARLQTVLQDEDGDVIPSRSVAVLEADGVTPIAQTLYTAATGGSVITAPSSNNLGYFEAYAHLPQRAMLSVTGVGTLPIDLAPDPADVVVAVDGAITVDEPIVASSGDHLFGRMSVGSTVAPNGNLLLVSETTTDTLGQTAAVETNVTAGSAGDYSALRVVIREMTAANNQSRPIESHHIRTSGSGNQPTHGLEISIQGNVAESVPGFYHNGLRIASLPTAWSVSGGVRQGNAIFIGQDEAGFQNGIMYRGTASEGNVVLFQVDKVGQVTSGRIIPLAGSTYDLGNPSGSLFWNAVYANNLVACANGSAGAPSVTWVNSTTTGFYRQSADVIGVASAGVESFRISAAGLIDWRRNQNVAPGGGSALTMLAATGGSGPTTATIAGFIKQAVNGTTVFVPYWT
jgi:hypothetical protein